MKRRIVVLIVTPIVLIGIALTCVFAIPVLYYGNMLLVIALHIKPTEEQIVGTYKATTEQGSATLLVNRDHTFTELIEPKAGSQQNISGNWKQSNLSSVGYSTQFFPYVGVLHDKFQTYAYGTPVFEKNLIGHISIEEYPDWGIYFYKQ
jgi:hypothetical protein